MMTSRATPRPAYHAEHSLLCTAEQWWIHALRHHQLEGQSGGGEAVTGPAAVVAWLARSASRPGQCAGLADAAIDGSHSAVAEPSEYDFTNHQEAAGSLRNVFVLATGALRHMPLGEEAIHSPQTARALIQAEWGNWALFRALLVA